MTSTTNKFLTEEFELNENFVDESELVYYEQVIFITFFGLMLIGMLITLVRQIQQIEKNMTTVAIFNKNHENGFTNIWNLNKNLAFLPNHLFINLLEEVYEKCLEYKDKYLSENKLFSFVCFNESRIIELMNLNLSRYANILVYVNDKIPIAIFSKDKTGETFKQLDLENGLSKFLKVKLHHTEQDTYYFEQQVNSKKNLPEKIKYTFCYITLNH